MNNRGQRRGGGHHRRSRRLDSAHMTSYTPGPRVSQRRAAGRSYSPFQPQEAREDLHIPQCHSHRTTGDLFHHVSSEAGVFIKWTSPEILSITGLWQNVERARKLILDEISRVDMQKVHAPAWVHERCHNDIMKAMETFPEIEIWSENQFICIRGHPSETSLVFNEIYIAAQRFEEYTLHVKKEFHAALIGKNGSNVKEIQQRFSVLISIPPRESLASNILLRGEKCDVRKAKSEIQKSMKQLKLQNSTLIVPLTPSDKRKIRDDFLQKLEVENDVKFVTTEDGVIIKGRQEILQKVKDNILSEVTLVVRNCIPVKNWLKPMLKNALKQAQSKFPDLQVMSDCEVDKIVLTGHPYEIEVLSDTILEKVAEVEANNDCVIIIVKKQFHRNIIGAKGSNIKKLREQYKVEITIPKNESDSSEVTITGPKWGVEAAVADIERLTANLDANHKKQLDFQKYEMSDAKILAHQSIPENSKVEVKFGHNKVILTGPHDDVESLAAILEDRMRIDRTDTECLTIMVKKQFHRNIIGAKGSTIKKLQEQHKVEITIPKNESDSSEVTITGPKWGVEAAVADIERLTANLDGNYRKQLDFQKNEMSDVKILVHQTIPENSKVEPKLEHNKVILTGPHDDVESLAAVLEDGMRIIRQQTQTISVPLNSSQALAVKQLRKNPVLDNLLRTCNYKVKIDFDETVPALILKGSGREMNEAHVKVVERMHELNDFCVLDVRIDEGRMGKFIGKNGRNVKCFEQEYQLEIITRRDTNGNVTLAGKNVAVESLCRNLESMHCATKVSYRKFTPRKRHNSAANLPSLLDSSNYPSYDGNACIGSGFMPESVLYKWSTNVTIVKFVKKSSVWCEKLWNIFPDESITVNESSGRVTVVGQANDSHMWQLNVHDKLTKYFGGFLCQQVPFHPRTNIERKVIDTDDLVVTWDEMTAYVRGMRDKVAEKLTEFEGIKNRKRPVCAKYSCEKFLITFLKRNLSIDGAAIVDGKSYITLTDEHVECHSEILEVDSDEKWRSDCKKALDQIFSDVTYRKVQVLPTYSGQMRTECCQCDEYVVEWIQEEKSLLIYGFKTQVIKEARRLEDMLFDLKNKKKNVSMKYRCENEEISKFVKESSEHFENLVNNLEQLGSPILDSNIVTVIGEILETESTSKWEEECRKKIMQCLQQYKVIRIKVEDSIRTRCISLAKNGRGVVTRWIESECAFCIIGIKQLVDATECCLKDQINKLRKEKRFLASADDASDQSKAGEIKSSFTAEVDDAVFRCLKLEESLLGVEVAKTSDRVKVTGKGISLQKAKEYIDSICVKELTIKRFGVYEFLRRSSTHWQIEYFQIKKHCKIHVEGLPDLEYGDEKFILLPKKSDLSVTVKVEEGDITYENVDLIVNTTNKIFSFDGPLSRCMFQKAGSDLRNATIAIDQDIQYSIGGLLNCKFIFHVAIPNTGESMENLILKILRKADEMKMKSIAMPTIGGGNGGWKSQDISIAMQNAFTKFAAESKSLKLVKVILFSGMSKFDKKLFHDNIQIGNRGNSIISPVEEEPTFLSAIWKFFGRSEPKPVQNVTPNSESAKSVAPPKTIDTHSKQHARILISATNQEDLDMAVCEFQNFANHCVQEIEINDMAVLRISKSDLDALEKMAHEQDVRVIVNKTRDIHKITLQGSYKGVSTLRDKAQEIIRGTSSDLPGEWTPSEERMLLVPLDRSSSEFQDIEKLFREGNKSSHLSLTVCAISRIQNPALYRQYQSKKGEIANRAIPPKTIEMRLFHGTDKDTINSICREGFNRSYAGKNATAFGKGTYFSTESSYSNTYATADQTGQCHMFVAEVLTGDHCKGDYSMIDAPRNPTTQELYDSVVNKSGNDTPTIYVVFRDWSAYPSYVITYTTW